MYYKPTCCKSVTIYNYFTMFKAQVQNFKGTLIIEPKTKTTPATEHRKEQAQKRVRLHQQPAERRQWPSLHPVVGLGFKLLF